MSCGGSYNGGGFQSPEATGQCVVDVVKSIVKAQHRAVEAEEDTCLTSCERSIADLLTDFEPNRTRLRYNTIPFVLYCKETCKPFVGSGIVRTRGSHFICVESPVLRVKNFVKGSDHCALLEILEPVYSDDDGGEYKHKCKDSICSYFHGKNVKNFRATGICITVDLRCFCGITCLDPINPLGAGGRFKDC